MFEKFFALKRGRHALLTGVALWALSSSAWAALLPQQGVWFEFWELPVRTIGNPPPTTVSSVPDYNQEAYRTHKLFGLRIDNFNLSKARQPRNYGARFLSQIQINTAGVYTFYLNSDDGAKLWVDGNLVVNNDGVHAAQELAGSVSLSAGRHNLRLDYFQWTGGATLELRFAGPNIGKQLIPNNLLFRPATPSGDAEVAAFGTLLRDTTVADPSAGAISINYAPSFIYDEVEGTFKIWSCYSLLAVKNTSTGDELGLLASTNLDGFLNLYPTLTLRGTYDATKFDDQGTCDPNVFRPVQGGPMYLSYSGYLRTNYPNFPNTTRIGMASSGDGGKSWNRLHGGNHIIAPGPIPPDCCAQTAYGTGQSAVVQANDGMYYMVHTKIDNTYNGSVIQRSSDPAFSPGSFSELKRIPECCSMDLAYDPAKEQFVLVMNETAGIAATGTTPAPSAGKVTLKYFDKNWNFLSSQSFNFSNLGWGFGEGVSLLTDSRKRIYRLQFDGVPSLVFAGSNADSMNMDSGLWAPWVSGNLRYIAFAEPPPPPPAATLPAGYYNVINRNSNKCVDVSGVSAADGAAVQQWDCAGANQLNQQWSFVATDSGYYRLVARHSGKVLDVAEFSAANAAPIQQWNWANGPNQQWQALDMGGGYYRFVARHSGKCLAVPGASTATGQQLQQYACDGTASQSFRIAAVGTTTTPPPPTPTAGKFGIDANQMLYHVNNGWTGNWNYLCLNGDCRPGTLTNGRYQRAVTVTAGTTYTLEFKVQDNATGQCLSGERSVTYVAGGATAASTCAP